MNTSVSFTQLSQNHSDATDADPRSLRLIAAAYELLDEDGLEGLTIRAVLARTGLARRAFYDNFSGKDELVLSVFAQTIKLAASYYQAKSASLPDPFSRLKMIVSSICLGGDVGGIHSEPTGEWSTLQAGAKRGAALTREHLRLADSRPQELQAALAPLLALIASHLRDGIAAKHFRVCDPDIQAALIYNLVSTTVHTEYLAEESGPSDPNRRKALTHELWEFCQRAIAF